MLDGSRRHLADQMSGGSGDLTLAELQEMASRQQQQLEAQQQVLVAKEQRLKYLRQQEARHAQLASEGDRIRKMRERVESQELKLKKLRALRGQAQQYMANNGNLNSELDAVKAVFNEKEKELATAVARVDRLNRQLQELRSGSSKTNGSGGGALDNKQADVAAELEKLRKELLIRNKLNEQQSNTISAKEKMLNQRREEVARMDARIKELQQRLKKRQAQELQIRQQQQGQGQEQTHSDNQKKDGGNHSSGKYGTPPGRSVATVEPYIQYAPQHIAKDDMYSKSLGSNFYKQDPKYQTLPARVKPMPRNGDGGNNARPSKHMEMNNNSELIEEYQLPTVVPARTNANTADTGKILDTAPVNESRSGVTPYQNVSYPHPTALIRPASNTHSKPPVLHTHQHPASIGAGDGPPHAKLAGSVPFNPIINIHEEERQAGSGQSSPASSEASNSSGGMQIKPESEVNTTSLGPVSAMIERLNRGGVTQKQQHQDRSTFTQRNGQPASQEGKPFTKSQQQVTPASADATSGMNSLPALPSPEMPSTSPSGFDEVDASSKGNNFQQSDAGPTAQNIASASSSAGPHLNQKPAPTYRYASKSQIANTYMPSRLGSAAMEKYQRNLNQIYRNLDSSAGGQSHGPTGNHKGDVQSEEGRTSFSQSKTGANASEMTNVDQAGHHPQFGVVSSPGYPDIASDKGSFKLNTPKQVRRRHSDSENEDLNRALQEHQEQEQHEKQRHQQAQQQKNVSAKTAGDGSASELQPSAKLELSLGGAKPSADNMRGEESKDKAHAPSTSAKLPVSEKLPQVASSKSESHANSGKDSDSCANTTKTDSLVKRTKSNLKKEGGRRSTNRVSFDPLALLLDASLEGELDLVKKVAVQVDDVSTPNDEGITALHNAICAGHYEIVKVLVEFGCDVNSPDSDGWTPLHCAASCNNLPMVKFLVEHGACVFATTISDQETAADKCEEEEDGYDGCSDYLYSIQEKLGITNSGEVYGVFDYQATKTDELSFQIGDKLTVLRKGDETEKEWWWARLNGKEGYIPRNLLGLYPRVIPGPKEVSNC